jgi:glutathione S-transferase
MIRRLKLHHYPASRSARAKGSLHEVVGDAFDVERVALHDGAQHDAAFLPLNPNHAVPGLEITWDDGRVPRLFESAAIVGFLADAYPDKGLAPPPGASPRAPTSAARRSTAADCVIGHDVIWARGYGLCQEEASRFTG